MNNKLAAYLTFFVTSLFFLSSIFFFLMKLKSGQRESVINDGYFSETVQREVLGDGLVAKERRLQALSQVIAVVSGEVISVDNGYLKMKSSPVDPMRGLENQTRIVRLDSNTILAKLVGRRDEDVEQGDLTSEDQQRAAFKEESIELQDILSGHVVYVYAKNDSDISDDLDFFARKIVVEYFNDQKDVD